MILIRLIDKFCLSRQVANFFMNARRRSRIGPSEGDEPAPYQQVQTIDPHPYDYSELQADVSASVLSPSPPDSHSPSSSFLGENAAADGSPSLEEHLRQTNQRRMKQENDFLRLLVEPKEEPLEERGEEHRETERSVTVL